jgi:tRNA (guanine37-N1)-methyltransferase
MTISILTLFPEMFEGPFSHSIIKNAVKKNKAEIRLINIRDFGLGRHKVVDDKPYGGGRGMVLRVDVLEKAIESAKKSVPKNNKRLKIILLDPVGSVYNQKKATELSSLDHLILVCGHYEGFDDRIRKFVDEEISIGDYILTGGEIPAMVVTDSVVRLREGVLPKDAPQIESFSISSEGAILEYPQFTRPEEYKKLKVPEILLSGNHKEIEDWRKIQSINLTKKRRPDLIKG